MADEVAIRIKLDAAEGARSVKELKQSIRDLTGEAVAAGQRGDAAMRTAYINAAGKAKEQLRELNKEIKLSGDAVGKLQAVQGVGMGIAHGFEAAKGAAALFGASSKDVEEQLLKIQAVMAFTQGITGIFEGVKAINMMSASFGIAATVSEAFGVSAAAAEAMATAGITVLIGALVAIITNFDKVSEFVKEHSALIRDYLLSVITLGIYPIVKGLMMLTGQMDQVSHAAEVNAAKMALQAEDHRKKVEELSGAYDNLHNKVEATREANVHTLSVLDDQIRLMKAQGASADEIYMAEKKVLDIKIAQAKMERDELLAQAELNKLVSAKWQLEDMYNKAQGGKGIIWTEEDKEKIAAQDDLINKLLTDAQVLDANYTNELVKNEQKRLDDLQKFNDEYNKTIDAFGTKQFDHPAELKVKLDPGPAITAIKQIGKTSKSEAEQEAERWAHFFQFLTKGSKEYLKEMQNFAQSVAALSDFVMQRQLAQAKGNAAAQEAIHRAAFERNKKIQEAMAIISGLQAIQSILAAQTTLPDPFGKIFKGLEVAGAVVTTADNVAKIKATTYNGGSGSSISVPTTFSTSAGVDLQGLQQQSTVLSNLQSQSNAKSPTVKAIVVETDITKTQTRVNTIQERAQIS